MNDSFKKAYDIASIQKDINERNEIINIFFATGYLDRDNAVFKIMELRCKDENVAVATNAELARSSVPFSQASDGNIIGELKMQIDILSAELAKKLSWE